MQPVIIWDNDGVLVDTESLYFQATQETLAEAGHALTERDYREHFLLSAMGTWHLLKQRGVTEASIERMRDRRDARYGSLITTESIEIKGVSEVLSHLAPRHRMAVATSNQMTHFETMHARTGFGGYFEHVVTAEQVPATKPDPAVYLEAVRRLGVDPTHCIAFEDSERGLRAAKGAGLRCWVLPSPLAADADWSEADGVLGDIAEVPALIASLKSQAQ